MSESHLNGQWEDVVEESILAYVLAQRHVASRLDLESQKFLDAWMSVEKPALEKICAEHGVNFQNEFSRISGYSSLGIRR